MQIIMQSASPGSRPRSSRIRNVLSVTANITREDFLEFLRDAAANEPLFMHADAARRKQLAFAIIILLANAACLLIAGFMVQNISDSMLLSVLIVLPVVCLIWWACAYAQELSKNAADTTLRQYAQYLDQGWYRPRLGPQTITISPDCIRIDGREGSESRPWTAMTRIVQTSTQVLLYTPLPDAYIVPKAAFPSQDSQENFLRTAREYLTAAHVSSPVNEPRPCPKCHYNLQGTTGSICPECGLRL
jgi:hypothetical protein